MNIQKRNNIISIFLVLIIIALAYVLIDSIVTPWQKEQARLKMRDDTRTRMVLVRDALIEYQRRDASNRFPSTLDSLVIFLKTDSLVQAKGVEMFDVPGLGFVPDSLIVSARPPHERFLYSVNDTIRPPLYLLKDPNSDDLIGSLDRITLLNAPSWN